VETFTGTAPHGASSNADATPKRIRRRTLTRVDKRTSVARRITELRALFTAALAGAGLELSPLRQLKIEQAAQAMAVAELARGKYMRDGAGDLDGAPSGPLRCRRPFDEAALARCAGRSNSLTSSGRSWPANPGRLGARSEPEIGWLNSELLWSSPYHSIVDLRADRALCTN